MCVTPACLGCRTHIVEAPVCVGSIDVVSLLHTHL